MKLAAICIALMFYGSYAFAWQYSGEKDEMGTGTTQYASVTSSTSLHFSFPYGGSQHATLTLRANPRRGRDVILSIERGQFMCAISCSVLVRFDSAAAARFSVASSADGDNRYIFLRGFDRFMGMLRRAHTLKIEAEFFQEGVHVLTFDVSDLGVWPPKP